MSSRAARSSARALAALALLVLLALAPSGSAAPRTKGARRPAAISVQALQARHGLEVSRLAVVAGGGVVDLRLRVVDREKARALLADHRPPRLLVGPKRKALEPPAHGPGLQTLAQSGAGYVLFPNTGDLVKRGAEVSLALGDVQVERIPVQ